MMCAVSERRGRYAPSPTGRQHLGNARTALLAWLQIRAAGGRFVMRVEDLDPGRSRIEYERTVLADLRWLGLDWDEGPDVGGPFAPYRQSERGEHYAAALDRLRTFACSCTRRELRMTSVAPHGAEPVYPGTCVAGPTDPSRPLSLRWHAPRGRIAIDDAITGPIEEDVETDIGDFVLRRGDGAWAYQLAVVVDDAAMAISEVVRGEDLLASTPRQVLLARALGLAVPRFAHVPLLLGPDGQKLSKRHGEPSMAELREGGADPARVVAVLARSAGLVGAHVERVTPRELVDDFDLARVVGATNVLDPAALA
jgi:glutamyl-tRNA synthetase